MFLYALIQRDLQNIWTKQGADRCVWYAIICININNKEYGRFMCVCKRYMLSRFTCVCVCKIYAHIPSRFTHGCTTGRISVFKAKKYSMCLCVRYSQLFPYPFVGCLNCFLILEIVIIMNMGTFLRSWFYFLSLCTQKGDCWIVW